MLFLSLLIRLDMGSPVLFVQVRPGVNGKPFKLIKFRTMRNAEDKFGEMLPDERGLLVWVPFSVRAVWMNYQSFGMF